MSHVKLTPQVEQILRESTIIGNSLKLPDKQLERSLYMEVNSVLVNVGGKWDRKTKSHIFSENPAEKLGLVLETGISRDKKVDFQSFYTPVDLAAQVVQLANVKDQVVLEPSAGEGALADQCKVMGAARVDCLEIDKEAIKKLENKGHSVFEIDFLSFFSRPYDRIVLNPPFTKNQDVKHVSHAYVLLRPGGRLVAIMAANITRKCFVELIEDKDYQIIDVEDGAFKSAGTLVKTIILILNKPIP